MYKVKHTADSVYVEKKKNIEEYDGFHEIISVEEEDEDKAAEMDIGASITV